MTHLDYLGIFSTLSLLDSEVDSEEEDKVLAVGSSGNRILAQYPSWLVKLPGY